MARPERKTVDYFPHYISDGKKMFYIEQKYGNDGYATWFKILESLASTDDHYLNLNSEMDLLFLSAKCRVGQDVLISILNDLSKLKEIDEFLWLNKIVYSHKFIESIQDAYIRRTNKCMHYDSLCIHLSSLCTTITPLEYKKQYNNTQTKVECTKVDKIKENNIDSRKLKFADTLKPFLSIYGKELLNEFYLYWIEPNKSNTKMRFEMQKTWSVELRLRKWASNDKSFNPKKEVKTYNPRG